MAYSRGGPRWRIVHKRDERGPYSVQEPEPVGRVPDLVLNSVVFMYPTEEDARSGSWFGGSGFVMQIPFSREDGTRPREPETVGPPHIYVVTNTHVARGCSIARIADPAKPLIRTSAWHHHPDGDDVSIAYLGIKPDVHFNTALDESLLATKEGLDERFIGPGDELYMVGRFIGLDVEPHNTTVLRQGVIALGETVGIENPRMERHRQESLVVEMHSRSGFSGSPVFLNLDPDRFLHEKAAEYKKRRIGYDLIGISWGMFPHHARPLDPETWEPTNDEWVVTDNSGMELVVPAWKIAELVDMEDVVAERKAREKRHRVDDALVGKAEATSSEKPFTRGDMEDALRKVSRRKPSQPAE